MSAKENSNVIKIKGKLEDFIGIYENAYSEEYCDKVIEQFEVADKHKFTHSRQETEGVMESIKKDQSIYTGSIWMLDDALSHTISGEFFETFWQITNSYREQYSVLTNNPMYAWGNKIQRTKPSGGYHTWHYESSGAQFCRRVLAYIMYLNDVEEGGETEFLYYSKRVKPKKGTLVLFPAAFTHTHRGNPPLSNTKYIATGWVEY